MPPPSPPHPWTPPLPPPPQKNDTRQAAGARVIPIFYDETPDEIRSKCVWGVGRWTGLGWLGCWPAGWVGGCPAGSLGWSHAHNQTQASSPQHPSPPQTQPRPNPGSTRSTGCCCRAAAPSCAPATPFTMPRACWWGWRSRWVCAYCPCVCLKALGWDWDGVGLAGGAQGWCWALSVVQWAVPCSYPRPSIHAYPSTPIHPSMPAPGQ